jgi:hypothetical protein
MVTEAAQPVLSQRSKRILPVNDWQNNGTGMMLGSPQDSVSLPDLDLPRLAVGV